MSMTCFSKKLSVEKKFIMRLSVCKSLSQNLFFFFSLSVFPIFTAFDFVFLMLETTDNFLHYIYISNPRCS